ncbi:MAG: type II and III secretion system protein family protein [Desulfovibrio sp.]
MTQTTQNTRLAIIILIAAFVMALPASSSAETITTNETDVVRLVISKSTVIDTGTPISRVSIANPAIAEFILISPTQVYLTAKEFGTTTLTMWKGKKISNVYDVIITPDVTELKRMINYVLPHEHNISVHSSGESLTLTGHVSSAANLSAALALAEAAAPEKVVNLMRVDGVQQVMLEVRVAEMSRNAAKRMGVNFQALGPKSMFYSFLNGLTQLSADGTLTQLNNVNGIFRSVNGDNSITGYIDALKANGLVRILAEPNLVCVSGESADFLAGGEVPIPIPQALGQVAIEFKPFGIGLDFTPTVMGSNLINLKVSPEVSELDYTKALRFSGYEIPSISSRKASTVIELADGQSFAIAGLISNTLKENASRFPVLGDVPVLGTLFRSSDYNKNKTELVIIVTAHLVKPVDMRAQTLPTDGFREPSDYEFYMLGLLEGREEEDGTPSPILRDPVATAGPRNGFDGSFGYTHPQ